MVKSSPTNVGPFRTVPDRLSVGAVLAPGLLAILALVLVPACAGKPPAPLPGVTEDVDQPDIPVPSGFKRRRSWSYDEFGFRSWQGEYVGETKRRRIAEWYGERMPQHGWVLKQRHGGSTKNVLVYTKGNLEDAEVTIYEEYFSPEDRYLTVVKAEIKPTPADQLQVEDVLSARASTGGGPLPAAAVAPGEPAFEAPEPSPIGSTSELEPGGLVPIDER